MKRIYKLCLALVMVALMVTGCGSTTTQTTATAETEVLENTTVVIGRLIEVAGNQITVQIGEYATTSQGMGGGMMQGEMSETMTEQPSETTEMPAGELIEGELVEGEMPARGEMGEMPEGMSERVATGEMPEGMQERGATGEMPDRTSGEMPEGMSERGAMGGQMASEATTNEATTNETTATATEATTNTNTNVPTETATTEAPASNAMSGEMPDRTSGEMPEGMGERSAGGMGEMSGGMGEMSGGMSGATESSSTSYSSVDELKDALISNVYSSVVLSDVYEVYTVPVGTPIDQYGVETTFLQLTEKSYVSIVFNEDGLIVSMEVLGG